MILFKFVKRIKKRMKLFRSFSLNFNYRNIMFPTEKAKKAFRNKIARYVVEHISTSFLAI